MMFVYYLLDEDNGRRTGTRETPRSSTTGIPDEIYPLKCFVAG